MALAFPIYFKFIRKATLTMQVKCVFYFFSAMFFLGIIGCASGRITCRPDSAIGNSSGDKGMITLAWDSNTEPYLGGYEVHYGTSSGFGQSKRKYKNCVDVGKATESPPGVTRYILTGLGMGKQYYIAVNAYSIYEPKTWSGFSNEVSGVAK